MRYKVAKTAVIDPAIGSPEWERAEAASVSVNRWAGYEDAPKTVAKMLRGPEGISLLMHTEETHLRMEHREENGEICEDSCMEFFFKPNNLCPAYLNFECNPRGVLHLGMGSGREDRVFPDVDRALLSIQSVANEGDWSLKLYIPDSLLVRLFGEISAVAKVNFYKCGDLTDHVHYGTWAEVETAEPDFHQPDFFGFLEL
jgi:hypothetical protein